MVNQVQERSSNFQNVKNMDYNQINKEDLIKAGAHFGHPVSKWNPNYKQFIVSKKNGIHIINVNYTIDYLDKAVKQLSKIIQSDGSILFVGTKNQAKDAIQDVEKVTRIWKSDVDKSGKATPVDRILIIAHEDASIESFIGNDEVCWTPMV